MCRPRLQPPREEYVRDECIVDGYRDGRNIYTVQPDPPGTTPTLTVESSSPLTVLNKGKDLLMRPDRNLDTWLANIKTVIET